MFFTREDIEKIHQGLLRLGIKDSELPETINVNSDDTLAVVQDGKNKKINILVDDKFMTDEEFNQLVNEYHPIIIKNDSYDIDEKIIIALSNKVENLHEIVPNYLRKANS